MKQFKMIGGTILALLMAGCSDDMIENQGVPPVSGEEIAFGVHSDNFNVPESRTIYEIPEGQTVTNYSRLNIAWVPDKDSVRVYCPESPKGFEWSDYAVKGTKTEPYLAKKGDTGVRWGDVSQDHHFYAFYPTERIVSGLENGTTITANIPTAQEGGEFVHPAETEQNIGNIKLPAHWGLIRPNMTFAMMGGKGTWTKGTDKNVTLDFKPLVSVVDVVINGPQDGTVNIYYVSVRSKTQPIVGNFTYNVGTGEFSGMEDQVSSDNNIATINCTHMDNGIPTPVILKAGEVLTLKFFLLPRDIKASDLSVSVTLDGGRTLTQNLVPEGSQKPDVDLVQGMITRVVTPKVKYPEASNWMSEIGDDVLFAGLSLPGSKHSYTGDLYQTTGHGVNLETDIMQFYQKLYVTDVNPNDETAQSQFDKGIRAFDLKLIVEEGEAYVYAGGAKLSSGLTIGGVLTNLWGEIQKSPSECAVVCVNFVYDGRTNEAAWTTAVVSAIDTWANANKNGQGENILKVITPQTTMLDMRGHIAVIINHSGEPATPSENVNYINYHSASVQETEIKTYNFNGNYDIHVQQLYQVNNPSITSSSGTYKVPNTTVGLVPYYIDHRMIIDKNAPAEGYDLMAVKERLMNRMFEEARTGTFDGLYINDLAGFCVVKNDESTGYVKGAVRSWHNGDFGDWGDHWHPNALETLYSWDRYCSVPDAMNYGGEPSSKQYGDTWFYVDDASEMGKGNGGNTGEFAERFNPKALNAVHKMVNDGRVPIGIVFMNFAGVNDVEIGGKTYQVYGDRLPALIMANNFMYPLETVK